MGVYSWSAKAGWSGDAPSSMTLTPAVQCQLIQMMESWHYSSNMIDILTNQNQTKNHSPARSWEASPHCDKRRYRLEIVPAVQCYTSFSGREMFSCLTEKMIMPSFPQDSTKYSSSCAEGHTPVCRGLPQSDLSRRHTLHTVGNINSPARDKTLPLTLAPRLFFSYSSWAEHNTVDTVRV